MGKIPACKRPRIAQHVDVQSRHIKVLQPTALAPHNSKTDGIHVNRTLLMLMLICGLGVAVTPMIWGVIGDALNRKINRIAPSHTSFTNVDDFFGAGSYEDTIQIQYIVHNNTINAVLGPEGLSVKQNVHAQTPEIIGILIDPKTTS